MTRVKLVLPVSFSIMQKLTQQFQKVRTILSPRLTGWTISLAVHLLIAILFVILSPALITNTNYNLPQTIVEKQTETLEAPPEVQEFEIDHIADTSIGPADLPDFAMQPKTGSSSYANTLTTTPRGNNKSISSSIPAQPRTSSFCGTTGTGRRICFVVDCSGSMVIALDYVKQELNKAVKRLKPDQYFHIIFFAGGEPIEMPGGKLVRASAPSRRKAVPFIEQGKLSRVDNPTAAWQAVTKALNRTFEIKTIDGSGVELIYLFTDGKFDHNKVNQKLQTLQAGHKQLATVNIIACGSPDNRFFLQSLAKRYKGEFRFVTDEVMAESLMAD